MIQSVSGQGLVSVGSEMDLLKAFDMAGKKISIFDQLAAGELKE